MVAALEAWDDFPTIDVKQNSAARYRTSQSVTAHIVPVGPLEAGIALDVPQETLEKEAERMQKFLATIVSSETFDVGLYAGVFLQEQAILGRLAVLSAS
jgi:hypothetical protein